MDEFTQTRPPDDLFDDEFTPIPEPAPAPVPSSPPAQPTIPSSGPTRPHRGQGGRGQRGPTRGRGGRGGLNDGGASSVVSKAEEATTAAAAAATAADQPTRPKEEGRVEAVKGDRSGTGGVKMKKLTEDELTARLASIKLKNAALEEAHRRAEADEASFQRREQQEAVKRREERANRKEMEGERERNRLRKMKAAQGREWDAEKKEEDFVGSAAGSSRYRRGAHGGVLSGGGGGERGGAGDGNGNGNGQFRGRADHGYASRAGPRGRGAGARGGRAPRGGDTLGRGRGGPSQFQRINITPDTSAESEFPALPAASATPTTIKVTGPPEVDRRSQRKDNPPVSGTTTNAPLIESPTIERGTWAEQMEVGTSSTDVR
ncbi:MAG: hypothetical protein M1816_007478 [Peltula sp. TS41687]|nr:MAG: hypothetical protein M1816_007478 [Peltula sp. TS41687]